jgi:hypothetical protein
VPRAVLSIELPPGMDWKVRGSHAGVFGHHPQNHARSYAIGLSPIDVDCVAAIEII